MSEEFDKAAERLREVAIRLMRDGAPSDFPTARLGEQHLRRAERARLARGLGERKLPE
jgi:hypothetical protein